MFKNILLLYPSHAFSPFSLFLSSHHRAKTSSLITDAPGQVGPPLQIHSTCCAPPLVCKAYFAEMVWVTTGEASHVKFWCWKANEQDPLVKTAPGGGRWCRHELFVLEWFFYTYFRLTLSDSTPPLHAGACERHLQPDPYAARPVGHRACPK